MWAEGADIGAFNSASAEEAAVNRGRLLFWWSLERERWSALGPMEEHPSATPEQPLSKGPESWALQVINAILHAFAANLVD